MDLSNINPKFLAGILIFVVVVGALLLFGRNPSPDGSSRWTGELQVWGVFDGSDVFDDISATYAAISGVTIEYTKKSSDTYERDLIEALAAGRGPDVFMAHNTWLPKHSDKMIPADPLWVTPDQIQATFPDVVLHDFVGDEGRTWAVPLYIDSLALYYNRDHFNDAGITKPPETWDEFFDAVEKLTRLDERGRIVRVGATLGTARNVNRSTDILSLLMMQSGSELVSDDHNRVTFDDSLSSEDQASFVPGEDAIRFYTDFSNPSKPIYTWDRGQDYSIDMFAQGRASMMLNYQHHMPTIDAKSPYLNYGIGFMPQVSADDLDVNYASYWGLAVSGQTDAPPTASWQFLLWMAGEEAQTLYQSLTGHPPARRTLIDTMKDFGNIGVFARQALTARSWYQPDNNATEEILAEAIEAVVLGQSNQRTAIISAAKRIEELLRQQ